MSGYLLFSRTGNAAFDNVLSTIEQAGDVFHSTVEWGEARDWLEGSSYTDRIDEAICAAAKQLGQERNKLESGVSPLPRNYGDSDSEMLIAERDLGVRQCDGYASLAKELREEIARKDRVIAYLRLETKASVDGPAAGLRRAAEAAINFRSARDALEVERIELLNDLDRVMDTVKYLVGIAERGTGTSLPDNQTAEAFVLSYVKHLEAENESLRGALRKANPAIVRLYGCYPPPYRNDAESVMVREALEAIDATMKGMK
jgi:hypothetical protein